MTWSRFDDAAAKHPKARLAGNDAWGLWQAAVQYCNRYLTDGVVPLAALAVDCLPEPISMAKAKKLADKLVEARVRDGGHGLFELAAPGRYVVHDFLDWNPSKEQVEAKRKADRDRKRGGSDSEGGSGAPPPRIPSGNPNGIPSGKRRDSEAPTPAGARVPAQPVPPSQSQPDHHQGPDVVVVAGEPANSEANDRETVCPLNLVDRMLAAGAHLDLASSLKCDVESVVDCLRGFQTHWVIGGGAGKRRVRWANKARQWVVDQHTQGKLRSPGAIEHSTRKAEDPPPAAPYHALAKPRFEAGPVMPPKEAKAAIDAALAGMK
jgi:hypothetical protein